MIRKLVKRILAIALCLALFPCWEVFAAQQNTSAAIKTSEAESEIQFALVMDVSSTMNKSDDKGYGKDAIQMFSDMLPVGNTKLGVITFGHNNAGNAFPFSEDLKPTTVQHSNYVQILSEMSPISSSKDSIKSSVKSLTWNGEQTPLDAAMLAGTDMLRKSKAISNRGCLVLLTDGDYKSKFITNPDHATNDIARAVSVLNNNGWSVYCIELDYANDAGKRTSAHQFLTENITDKCNGKTYQVEKVEDVGMAFMEIIDNFYGTGNIETAKTDSDGYAIKEFTIDDLTSETNITVNSNELKGVQLSHNGEIDAVFGDVDGSGDATDYDKTNYSIEWGKVYCNIKMMLPIPGTWEIRVRAASDTSVIINNISFSDLLMTTEFDPEGNDESAKLTKADTIAAEVALEYDGKNVRKESLGNAEAFIGINNLTAGRELPKKSMEWDDDSRSFKYQISVAETGEAGKLEFWSEVKYGENELIKGEPVYFYTYNKPAEMVNGASLQESGYVRQPAEPIETSTLFINPDDDLLECRFSFDGPKAKLSEDNKQLLIEFGAIPGSYTGMLKIWDADMGEAGALQIPVMIETKNHPMQVNRIHNIDMVSDKVKEEEVDIHEAFVDEDQEKVDVILQDDFDKEIIECTMADGKLKLKSLADGKTTITLKAVDDDGKEYLNEFSVKGATDASIRKQKIKELIEKIGIVGIILAILVFVAVLVFLFIKSNSKISGEWDISIKIPGYSTYKFTLDASADVTKKDRRSSTLSKILDLENRTSSNPVLAKVLEHSYLLDKIKVSGLFKQDGCKLTVVPPAELRINGGDPVKTAKHTAGVAEVSINDDDISITIEIAL